MLECSAFYSFGKFLLEDKHTISKSTNKTIANFIEQLPNLENKKDPSVKVHIYQNFKEIIPLKYRPKIYIN